MAKRVFVQVVGARRLARNFRHMSYQMASFGDAFDQIGEYFREQVQIQFDGRGALAGSSGPWAPLSPTTIKLRGGTSRQLVRYKDLMHSYTSQDNAQNITQLGAQHAKFGSSYHGISNKGKIVPLAKWHQTGTSRMPARPVVLSNKKLSEDIVEEIMDHIFDGWVI